MGNSHRSSPRLSPWLHYLIYSYIVLMALLYCESWGGIVLVLQLCFCLPVLCLIFQVFSFYVSFRTSLSIATEQISGLLIDISLRLWIWKELSSSQFWVFLLITQFLSINFVFLFPSQALFFSCIVWMYFYLAFIFSYIVWMHF